MVEGDMIRHVSDSITESRVIAHDSERVQGIDKRHSDALVFVAGGRRPAQLTQRIRVCCADRFQLIIYLRQT